MKPVENVEKLIKKLRYKTSAETHDRILGNVLQAIEKKERQKLAIVQLAIWRILTKSLVAKLATAIVIIVIVGFVVLHKRTGEQPDSSRPAVVTKSPAEMMTAASLNIAYRRGGIDAVERQCDKACELLGSKPEQISIKELLAELINNDELERTKL